MRGQKLIRKLKSISRLIICLCFVITGGVDFETVSQILTFDPLNQELNFSLTLIDDEILDNFEFFTIDLSLVSDSDRITLAPDTLFVNILDNDVPPRECYHKG